MTDDCLAADDGRWTMDDGRWTMDDGRWTMDDGRWTMDDGRWTMDDGRWTMDDGRWTMDDGVRMALDFVHRLPPGYRPSRQVQGTRPPAKRPGAGRSARGRRRLPGPGRGVDSGRRG